VKLAHQAYVWGVKAAQDGKDIVHNPYANVEPRAAWIAGYEAMRLSEEAFDADRRQPARHAAEHRARPERQAHARV